MLEWVFTKYKKKKKKSSVMFCMHPACPLSIAVIYLKIDHVTLSVSVLSIEV